MRRAIAPVATLLFGVAILLTGQGLQGTLVPVRATIENFNTVAIGLVGAAYFCGFTYGCVVGGKLLRRVGHVRVFAAMTAAASATPLLVGLFVNVWAWMGLRLIAGFCFAVLYVVIESWLNELSTNENRGTVFSVYVFINLTVLAAGQQMLLLEDPSTLYLFAMVSVLISLAAVPVVLSTSPTPKWPQEVRIDVRRLYRISPAGMLGCIVSGLANGAFWALAPVFTASYSSDVSLAAWFMTAVVLGGAAGQWPLGRLSDRIDRRIVIVLSCGISAAVGLTMWLLAPNLEPYQIALLGAAWGAGAFPLYSLAAAHANDFAEPDDYVMISSGLLLMYGIGAIIGPFIASAAMAISGEGGGLYVYTGVVHLVLAAYIILRILRRAPAPAAKHIAFSEALNYSQTKSQVYEEESSNTEQANET